jgi:hypothetical protein
MVSVSAVVDHHRLIPARGPPGSSQRKNNENAGQRPCQPPGQRPAPEAVTRPSAPEHVPSPKLDYCPWSTVLRRQFRDRLCDG